jgi:hypothetical protein
MTPKDKASDLTSDFYAIQSNEYDYGINWEMAKQCALIAVDEILKSVPKQPSISITMPHFEATVYWEEVKKELENYDK